MVEAGAGRNDVAHDDGFLETPGNPRVTAWTSVRTRVVSWNDAPLRKLSGFERRLGDAEHTGEASAGLPPLLSTRSFSSSKSSLSICSPHRNVGVARFGDAHLAEHLADDDFDVLVVDGDTLQAVNLLHFADEVFLQFLRSADLEDFVRVHRAFGQLLALLYHVALENNDVLADGDEVFLLRLGLRVLDEHAALAAHARAKVHDAVDLGDFRRVLRPARLEQFGHPRQTAGDVLGLRCLRGVLAMRVPAKSRCPRSRRCAPRRNRIIGDDFAGVIGDGDLRVQILLVLDDHHGLRWWFRPFPASSSPLR